MIGRHTNSDHVFLDVFPEVDARIEAFGNNISAAVIRRHIQQEYTKRIGMDRLAPHDLRRCLKLTLLSSVAIIWMRHMWEEPMMPEVDWKKVQVKHITKYTAVDGVSESNTQPKSCNRELVSRRWGL